jgi:iron complex outermembrane receptor protein
VTRYRDLRSQEPVGVAPFPAVLANGLRGRTAGGEVTAEYQPVPAVRLRGAYAFLDKTLEPSPGSRDLSGGIAEGNDPRHQGLIAWSIDLPRLVTFDGQLRMVGELPDPRVPAYAEADFRLAWRISPNIELSLVGRDLLHDDHVEFGSPLVRESMERSVYARADFQF